MVVVCAGLWMPSPSYVSPSLSCYATCLFVSAFLVACSASLHVADLCLVFWASTLWFYFTSSSCESYAFEVHTLCYRAITCPKSDQSIENLHEKFSQHCENHKQNSSIVLGWQCKSQRQLKQKFSVWLDITRVKWEKGFLLCGWTEPFRVFEVVHI